MVPVVGERARRDMTQVPEAFLHYLAAWNESDPERIRGHLDAAWSAWFAGGRRARRS